MLTLLRKFYFDSCLSLPGHSIHIGYSGSLNMGFWVEHEYRQNTIAFGFEFDTGFEDYSENGKEWYEILND